MSNLKSGLVEGLKNYGEVAFIIAYQAFEPYIPYGVSSFLTLEPNLDFLGNYSHIIPPIQPTLWIPLLYGAGHEVIRNSGLEGIVARVTRNTLFHSIPVQASVQYLGEILVTVGIAEGFRLGTPITRLTKYLSEYFSQRK